MCLTKPIPMTFFFFFLVVRFKSSTTSMTKLGQPASGDLDETNPRSPNIIYFLSYEMTLATPVSKGWNPSNFFFCRQNLIKKIFKRFDTNFSKNFFFKCSEKYPFNWGFFSPWRAYHESSQLIMYVQLLSTCIRWNTDTCLEFDKCSSPNVSDRTGY